MIMTFKTNILVLNNLCAHRVFVFEVIVGGPSILSTNHLIELFTNHTNSLFSFFIFTFFNFGFDLLDT